MTSERELALSFCDYEVVLHGIGLRGLREDVRARRLRKPGQMKIVGQQN